MTNKTLLLKDFLPYRLSLLSNKISRTIADGYEERFSLTLPEWRVMAALGEEPNISANQVVEKTAMDKVAVSRAVKKLLEDGRIERQFSQDDRRRSVLTLSESGAAIYQDIIPIALTHEQRLLANFSDEEKAQFDALFDKLMQNQSAL
ncbi:MarR family winged helix-turn-helix transcriptional regulator [Kordiimonas aquimaris]|uniref:MarR family winged helix-turn-helix transcriptional regulator n=1 Tax=Kordiimonas aquimaris TaxID=707591 RepID=UPI0021CE6B1D|nr:MarR family transcriptional regulator [Kordiimonas aquimaris]